MFLSSIKILNFRCFDEEGATVPFRSGLTALVGENDAGKSAIMDAIRCVLGTSDGEWLRVQESDFHNSDTEKPIRIVCTFDDLNENDQKAFLEFLTYEKSGENRKAVLYVHWTIALKKAGSTKTFFKAEMTSGKNGDGPTFSQEAKEMLRVTYLRPLRDAASAIPSPQVKMSAFIS